MKLVHNSCEPRMSACYARALQTATKQLTCKQSMIIPQCTWQWLLVICYDYCDLLLSCLCCRASCIAVPMQSSKSACLPGSSPILLAPSQPVLQSMWDPRICKLSVCHMDRLLKARCHVLFTWDMHKCRCLNCRQVIVVLLRFT